MEHTSANTVASGRSGGRQCYDVIVVGGGIMGSCTAHAVASRGFSILLLEQFDLLHYRGSSHGESRTIRATYPESYYPPLVHLAQQLWVAAERESGYSVLTPTMHLDIGPSDNPSFLAALRNVNGTVTDDVGARWSGMFQLPEGWLAKGSDLGGIIKPTKAVAMFQALAFHHGAVLMDHMEVVMISREDRREEEGGQIQVKTACGEVFWCGKCIVTAGAWTKKLISIVSGIDLPIQPLHTTICYWKIKEGHEDALTPQAGFLTFASYGEPYIYGTPSMEFPGLIKIAMHSGIPCDPDHRDWGLVASGGLINPVAKWIEEFMPRHVDAAQGPVIQQSCMYSMTPDEDFVIDFLGGEFGKDVVVAGGFSGHGFKMGPAIGLILAEMAIKGEAEVVQGIELSHFRYGRFKINPLGNIKDFGKQVALNSCLAENMTH